MKNYSDEIFVDKLRWIKFPNYSNHISLSHAYQDFVTKFLSAVDSVSPIKTFKVNCNSKPCFGIDFVNAIRNRYKHYKNFKQSGRTADMDNFKHAKLSCEKLLMRRKNFAVRKNSQKIRAISKNSDELQKLWVCLLKGEDKPKYH